jgi:hypothetical protein
LEREEAARLSGVGLGAKKEYVTRRSRRHAASIFDTGIRMDRHVDCEVLQV